MKRRHVTLTILVLLSLASVNAWGTVPYTITDLGLGQAYDVNAGGQVAGTTGSYHGFVYSGGTLTDLGTLGGPYSGAMGINKYGTVAGEAQIDPLTYHAFYWDGSMHDIGAPGIESWANDINDSGIVVGEDKANYHAFFYDGAMHDLGSLGGSSEARSINASGQIVGHSFTSGGADHAFLYSGGTMSDIGTLPGGNYANAIDINAGGKVVGNADNGLGHYRAFLYDGAMQDLGTLSGYSDSFGIGINAAGQIVGTVSNSGAGPHAFLDDNGGMVDLNSLVTNLGSWSLQSASAINDSGMIVGYGLLGGNTHAFLLTPVPEPSTLLLAAMGLVGLLAYAWRKRK